MADRRRSNTAVRHSVPPARSASLRSQRSIVSRNSIDIFSDEFSLERLQSASTSRSISPVDESGSQQAASSSQARLISTPSQQHGASENPVIPRNSISKRALAQRYATAARQPSRVQSTTSRASLARTASTGSQLTLPPRAPSPYTGATGPSHPYGMYPQGIRNSSVSTVRQPDSAYAGPSAPEHAYAMYGQNTVPEEEAEPVIPHSVIPVGFPGMRGGFQRQVDQQGEDVGDIIGPDGHMEQLPPYSRFPDEASRKRTLALAVSPTDATAQAGPATPTPDSPLHPPTTSGSDVPLSQAQTENGDNTSSERSTVNGDSGSGGSFSEKLRRNGRRRMCFGLPLWLLLGVTGVIIFAATIGAVIGGVVANQRGRDETRQPSPDSVESPTTTVTATSYIDATPLPSGTRLPDIPIGEYEVPTYQIKSNSATCVVDPSLTEVWSCIPPFGLGVNISSVPELSRKRGDSSLKRHTVTFKDYSLRRNFSYGAQLPDFKGQQFELTPNMDKDQPSLGPALFFFTFYDKLNILPEGFIAPPSSGKRSIDASIVERQFPGPPGGFHRKEMADPGERPWFCYWNETIFEMFVYVNQTITDMSKYYDPPPRSSGGSSPSKAFSSATAAATGYTVTGTPIYLTPTASPTGFSGSSKRDDLSRRGGDRSEEELDLPIYPNYVKVIEKRKPDNKIQPYCQQMQVNTDGSWQPAQGVPTVIITESEPIPTATGAAASATSGSSSRLRRLARDIQIRAGGLEPRQVSGVRDSNCACLWLST